MKWIFRKNNWTFKIQNYFHGAWNKQWNVYFKAQMFHFVFWKCRIIFTSPMRQKDLNKYLKLFLLFLFYWSNIILTTHNGLFVLQLANSFICLNVKLSRWTTVLWSLFTVIRVLRLPFEIDNEGAICMNL